MAKTDKRRKQAAQLPHQIELAVRAADDKKAVDLIVLDLRKAAGFTDFFVICSGTNARQVRAIADASWSRLRPRAPSRRTSKGYDARSGFCSTTSTSSCTSSRRTRGCSTGSSGSGAMPSGSTFAGSIARFARRPMRCWRWCSRRLRRVRRAARRPSRGPVCDRCWQLDSFRLRRRSAIAAAIRCRRGARSACRSSAAPRCRRMPPAIDRARAIGDTTGALRAIVHALKYDGRRSLARPLAALMRERAADLLAGVDCAVPVPLHPSRRRQRGFNQAADLARPSAACRSAPR